MGKVPTSHKRHAAMSFLPVAPCSGASGECSIPLATGVNGVWQRPRLRCLVGQPIRSRGKEGGGRQMTCWGAMSVPRMPPSTRLCSAVALAPPTHLHHVGPALQQSLRLVPHLQGPLCARWRCNGQHLQTVHQEWHRLCLLARRPEAQAHEDQEREDGRAGAPRQGHAAQAGDTG